MNIYVGNLGSSVSEDDLRQMFEAYGNVSSVALMTDKFTGQSRGFGFVEMKNASEADAAIKALNKHVRVKPEPPANATSDITVSRPRTRARRGTIEGSGTG